MSEEKNPLSNEEFARLAMDAYLEHEQLGIEWKPCAFYNEDGDLIEWHSERVRYYGERVNEIITLYRAEDDDRIVGGCIKNIDYILGNREKPSQKMD